MALFVGDDHVDLADAVVEVDVGLAGRNREVRLPRSVQLKRETFGLEIAEIPEDVRAAFAQLEVVVRLIHCRQTTARTCLLHF